MIKININKNFKTDKNYGQSLIYIMLLWGTHNMYSYGYNSGFYAEWNSEGNNLGINSIWANPEIVGHIRSVWSTDDDLYVVNPKFKYGNNLIPALDFFDIDGINDVKNWCSANNIALYNIYYRDNNRSEGMVNRYISFGSVKDQTMYKLRFG